MNKTIITGGHFMLTSEGPNLNQGTIDSFAQAIATYREMKHNGYNVSLGLLINDIGSVCSESSCSISAPVSKNNFQLPKEYEKLLNGADLHIFWEKHMRNRGKKLLAKLLARKLQNLVYEDDSYVYQVPDQELVIQLTRKSLHDKYGTPACPLIMCAFALDKQRLGFNNSINYYYLGEDNYLNVSNHFVIEKGKFLAKQFIKDIEIDNRFLFE